MMDEAAIITVEPKRLSLGVLEFDTPDEIVERASKIATALARVVNDQKMFSIISGKKFVHVEGWETLGAMLGIVPREIQGSTIEHENGDFEATVELVRVNDGAIIGRGSALCGCDELDRNGKPTWGNRARYARRSMAVTRAAGKAFRLSLSWIMRLAGYEATPAEEIEDRGPQWSEYQTNHTNGNSRVTDRPEPPVPQWTHETAGNVTTKKGKLLSSCGLDELVLVAEKTGDATIKSAAQFLLAEKEREQTAGVAAK